MLEVNHLSVNYGHISALRDTSIRVEDGEIITIIGANGAGKSTMLKTIAGLIKPAQGEVLYNGRQLPYGASKVAKAGIALVPEGRHVFPSLSVRENLILGGYLRPKKEIDESIETIYSLFPRLKEREKQRAGTLSGGEQQMLAIGRGVMGNPKVMLFDEPSLGLAPLVVQEIFTFFPLLNRERGITMVIVEQNAKMAFKVAHRAYVLENGVITREDLSETLRSDPSIIKAYLAGS
jgi:branched-chain amino acid transport system ATP-binding protein